MVSSTIAGPSIPWREPARRTTRHAGRWFLKSGWLKGRHGTRTRHRADSGRTNDRPGRKPSSRLPAHHGIFFLPSLVSQQMTTPAKTRSGWFSRTLGLASRSAETRETDARFGFPTSLSTVASSGRPSTGDATADQRGAIVFTFSNPVNQRSSPRFQGCTARSGEWESTGYHAGVLMRHTFARLPPQATGQGQITRFPMNDTTRLKARCSRSLIAL